MRTTKSILEAAKATAPAMARVSAEALDRALLTIADILEEESSVEDILAANQKDLAAATGMNAYRLKLYLGAAKSFDRGRGVRILEELSRTDVASKFGGISGYTAVDIFVARCL